MTTPAKYIDPDNTLRAVYDSIESDIKALRQGTLKLQEARVILVGRKTQLCTAELALALQRLTLQYERTEAEAKLKLKKAG